MAVDRNGNSMDKYPRKFHGGDLIGLTPGGVAAYHRDDDVFLAEMVNGELESPPKGYNLASSVDLSGFDWDVGDYIEQTAQHEGPWKELTGYAKRFAEDIDMSTGKIVD